MPLQHGLQIVVQAPDATGAHCTGFVQAPVDEPLYIAVVAADPGDTGAEQVAERLGAELKAAIATLSASTRILATPCSGGGLGQCHALNVAECRKVLVPVFADGVLAKGYRVPQLWSSASNTTIVPVTAGAVSPAQLPAHLAPLNAMHWTPGDRGVVMQLLRVLGIASQRPRIFISYVRRDSEPVAMQLFDHLHRRGFEVFLDRFSIPPGLDIATKLQQELSMMGTVLVLESARINRSPWTRGEVDFARMHRLGLCALQLPGGKRVAGVGAAARRPIPRLTVKRRLSPRVLRETLDWVQAAHARAEHRRREYLRSTMSDALLRRGVRRQAFLSPDVLVGENAAGRRFAVRLSNLPADLDDFHHVGRLAPSVGDLYVLAPGRFVDWRRKVPLQWLEAVSKVQMRDEGELDQLAGDLA